jgi:hypothetical protein
MIGIGFRDSQTNVPLVYNELTIHVAVLGIQLE